MILTNINVNMSSLYPDKIILDRDVYNKLFLQREIFKIKKKLEYLSATPEHYEMFKFVSNFSQYLANVKDQDPEFIKENKKKFDIIVRKLNLEKDFKNG